MKNTVTKKILLTLISFAFVTSNLFACLSASSKDIKLVAPEVNIEPAIEVNVEPAVEVNVEPALDVNVEPVADVDKAIDEAANKYSLFAVDDDGKVYINDFGSYSVLEGLYFDESIDKFYLNVGDDWYDVGNTGDYPADAGFYYVVDQNQSNKVTLFDNFSGDWTLYGDFTCPSSLLLNSELDVDFNNGNFSISGCTSSTSSAPGISSPFLLNRLGKKLKINKTFKKDIIVIPNPNPRPIIIPVPVPVRVPVPVPVRPIVRPANWVAFIPNTAMIAVLPGTNIPYVHSGLQVYVSPTGVFATFRPVPGGGFLMNTVPAPVRPAPARPVAGPRIAIPRR